MEDICSDNFIKIFSSFENKLNALFQRNTKFIKGGNVREPTYSKCYEYEKRLVSKEDVIIEINVLYNKIKDDYLYYSYNLFFGENKLMFHYEPTHKEHFQPHINVYVEEKELKNLRGEGIHILSQKYHPFEILELIERYFG
ncbi:hypothetical protein QUF80_13150 [Desulfococcaceae bacterium HSG8]|nr:hypothetical protein [Desulfococcaceae bacterium HSG8]